MHDKKGTLHDTHESEGMSGSLVVGAAMFALANGVDIEQITEATGLSQEALHAHDQRLPNHILPTIWNLIIQKNPGRAVTLEMAAVASNMYMGVLSYGTQFASKFREVIDIYIRFQKLLSDQLALEFIEDEHQGIVQFSHPMDALDRGAAAEVGLALGIRYFRKQMGSDKGLLQVHFSQEPIGPLKAYQEYFKIPVLFNQARNAMIFAKDILEVPSPTGDPLAFVSIQRHLERVYQKLTTPSELQEVKQAIMENAARGDYSAQGLAKRLQVSLRVLQRQLAAHRTTVSQLLDQTREAQAKELLQDLSLSIEEVAFVLGYSEGRAFRRFFKRMTQQTPAQFRKSQRS